MTTDNFCFYLQNRQIQTGLAGGQWYSNTSPFSIPWFKLLSLKNGWETRLLQNYSKNIFFSKNQIEGDVKNFFKKSETNGRRYKTFYVADAVDDK